MATVTVLLRDQAEFERERSYETEPENVDSTVFMWEDGNYACDCIRSLFLYGRGYGEALPCSHGKIKVVWLKVDGEVRYSE